MEMINLDQVRAAARHKLGQMQLPSHNEEAWRKIELRGLEIGPYLEDDSQTKIEVHIPAGLKVRQLRLEEISNKSQIDERLRSILARASERQGDYFETLNLSWYQKGYYLEVQGQSEEPLRIVHQLQQGTFLAHRLIVLAATESEFNLVEIYNTKDIEGPVLLVPHSEVLVDQAAHVSYTQHLQMAASHWNFSRQRLQLKRDAKLISAFLHTGGHRGKNRIYSELVEPGSEYRGLGLKIGRGDEFADLEMNVHHSASHTQSSLLYKTVMDDHSHSVFYGNLDIERGLKHVESHQENHNLVLSQRARAQSMPNLLIQAEGVSCEHGATVGALDPQAIFFLMARGLSYIDSRKLLIEAFIHTLLTEIKPADYAAGLLGQVLENLELGD